MYRVPEGRGYQSSRPYPYEGYSDEENRDRGSSSGGRFPAAGSKGYSRSGEVTSSGQKRTSGKYGNGECNFKLFI